MFYYLLLGLFFGTVAGISPGPLLALVISQTIKHNKKEGIKIAITPVITDLPIILISIFILSRLADYSQIIGFIFILGAVFILYLGYECFFSRHIHMEIYNYKIQSVKKGVLANILSPHPYLFWITIGGPAILKAYQINLVSTVFFIGGFYCFLVGSKIAVAFIVDRSKEIISNRWYYYIMKGLGLLLAGFSIFYLYQGIGLIFNK